MLRSAAINRIGNGGGIYIESTVVATNITVTNNESTGYYGGGVSATGGSFTSTNSIYAGNHSNLGRVDFDGSVTSGGHNIVGSTSGSSGFGGTDQLNTDPLLDVLLDNGGPTKTHALLAPSTAIDPAGLTGAPATDARGVGRDGTPDIGAYEYVSGGPNVIVVTTSNDLVNGNTGSINALLLNDGGDGISLREAITAANNTANIGTADEIHFFLPQDDAGHVYYKDDGIAGSLSLISATTLADSAITDFDADYVGAQFSWYSIDVLSALPTITDAVSIDGTSQTGFDGNPIIELDGSHDGGNIAAGRRVQLPWGANNLDVTTLTAEGQTIMRRSLEWAGGLGTPGNVLLVVDNSGSLNAQDLAKKSLMEGWGFTVNVIDSADSQAAFDAAVAVNDVAFISEDIVSGDLGSKLRDAPIGVVAEEANLSDVEFGTASSIYLGFRANRDQHR